MRSRHLTIGGPDDEPCSCCGAPTRADFAAGAHRVFQCQDPRCARCGMCHGCEGVHGDEFERRNLVNADAATRRGRPVAWHVVAVQAVDDAHLTGRLFIDDRGDLAVDDPPPRWLVVLARATARGEHPVIDEVLGAALAPYIGRRGNGALIGEMERSIGEALSTMDPNIVSVSIQTRRDTIDPENIVVEVRARTSTIGAITLTPDVPIPVDVTMREPAKA